MFWRMFVTLQLPMGDVRPFVAATTGRLARPRWMNPAYDEEFVRGIGPVRRRRRGGVSPWPTEQTYCDAAPMLRFAQSMSWLARENTHPALRSFKPIFRRLFVNGETVSRLEVGFANAPGRQPINAWSVHRLLIDLANFPVRVVEEGGGRRDAALGITGRSAVAAVLLKATTHSAQPVAPFWLTAGRPLFVVEFREGEIAGLPAADWPEKRVALPGIQVSHANLRRSRVWYIKVEADADKDAVRRLRVHLLRLHAERAALGIVLNWLADGRLSKPSDGEPFARLESYLERSIGFLQRRDVYGFDQPRLLELAYEFDDLVNEGQRQTLLSYLSEGRERARRAVDEITTPSSRRYPVF